MEKLGSYELTGHLTAQNGGYSVWGFGRKNGRNYFLKQFLSPKYPENDTISSPASIEKRKRRCESFQQKKAALYERIDQNSDGNAVRIEEFFRVENKYYISMRKIDSLDWRVEDVVALPEKDKRFLCSVIAHGISGLHKGHVVHADLKHDNILFMRSSFGVVTAKIIDFDSGFLESDPPAEGEEIVGDLVYFSPEACKHFWGEAPVLTCKMDVFALGVLFHQYFSGKLPGFDPSLGHYTGEAVAKGGSVTVAADIPEDVRVLLQKMLDADPANRPSATEVYALFAGRTLSEIQKEEAGSVPAPPTPKPPVSESTSPISGSSFFRRPGDL